MSEEFVVEGLSPLQPVKEISLGENIYQSLLSYTGKHPALLSIFKNLNFGRLDGMIFSDHKNNIDFETSVINGTTGEYMTFSKLLTRTCSLAEAMRACGYGTGTTVLVSSKNHLQFFVPVIASLYIGARVTTMNPTYTQSELLHVVEISKPNIVFCSEEIVPKYVKVKQKVGYIERIVTIDSPRSTMSTESLNDFIGRNIRNEVSRILTTPVNSRENVAFILYSSGTTGMPKGVMLTHRNINAMFLILQDPRLHQKVVRALCVLPFFHSYGLCTTLTNIHKQTLTVFLSEFNPKIYLQSLQDYKITRLYLAPSLLVFLAKSPLVLQYDLSSVNEAFCGAAPLKKSTEEEFKRRCNLESIRQAYGLTESTIAVTISGTKTVKPKPGSSGRVSPYNRVAIRDLETGKFLGPNKEGEICIKGDMVMKGYCGNPEATKNTFTEDGWLLTGDVGYYDEDGDFFITDRVKELIKYKGFQVAPAELEALLLTHSEIVDSGVIGVPDEIAGEVPFAFVVKTEKSNLSEKDVQDYVKERLSPQKWIRGGVRFVNSIPKNPTGKVLRRELRKIMKQYQSKL